MKCRLIGRQNLPIGFIVQFNQYYYITVLNSILNFKNIANDQSQNVKCLCYLQFHW